MHISEGAKTVMHHSFIRCIRATFNDTVTESLGASLVVPEALFLFFLAIRLCTTELLKLIRLKQFGNRIAKTVSKEADVRGTREAISAAPVLIEAPRSLISKLLCLQISWK